MTLLCMLLCCPALIIAGPYGLPKIGSKHSGYIYLDYSLLTLCIEPWLVVEGALEMKK